MPQITPSVPTTTKTVSTGRQDITKVPTNELLAMEGGEVVPAIPAVEGAEATSEDSPKLVELARRTKAQRQLQIKLQQDQQVLEQQKAEFAKKDAEYQTNYVTKDRLKTDLVGVLTELGYDSKMLSEAFQSQPVAVDMEIRALKQKIASMEAAASKTTEDLKQDKQGQYESAINKIRADVKQLVKTDANFETIKELAAEEEVVAFIKETFEQGFTDKEGTEYPKGYVFSNVEAAQLIEERLVEESLRRANLTKVKQKLAPVTDEPIKQIPTTNNKQTPKTLTNTMSTSSNTKSLSTAERRARAIAIAMGQIPPT